jgi:hypothetical protein
VIFVHSAKTVTSATYNFLSRLFFSVTDRFLKPWLHHTIVTVEINSPWKNSAKQASVQQFFGVTMWKLWQQRNTCVFRNTIFDPVKVVSSTALFVDEYNNANLRQLYAKNSVVAQTKW